MPEYSIRYVYHRGGTAAMLSEALTFPDTLAHHHIISFSRMFAIGALTLCHLKIEPKYIARLQYYNFGDLARALENITQLGNVFDLRTENITLINTIYAMAWTPGNLFVGPASKLRSDDPGQNKDKNPLSMPLLQTEFISKLTNAENCITSYVPNKEGEGGGQYNAISISSAKLIQLTDHFITALSYDARQLDSKIMDWCAVINRRKYHIYFYQGHGNLPKDKAIFTFKVAIRQSSDRVEQNRCIKIFGYRERGHNSEFVGTIINSMESYCEQMAKPIDGFIRNCRKIIN